jgi:hypothetical protein
MNTRAATGPTVWADGDPIDELIADCADIPAGLRTAATIVPGPRTPTGWVVNEACLEQVAQLDDY